jgi:hypothetical protein
MLYLRLKFHRMCIYLLHFDIQNFSKNYSQYEYYTVALLFYVSHFLSHHTDILTNIFIWLFGLKNNIVETFYYDQCSFNLQTVL